MLDTEILRLRPAHYNACKAAYSLVCREGWLKVIDIEEKLDAGMPAQNPSWRTLFFFAIKEDGLYENLFKSVFEPFGKIYRLFEKHAADLGGKAKNSFYSSLSPEIFFKRCPVRRDASFYLNTGDAGILRDVIADLAFLNTATQMIVSPTIENLEVISHPRWSATFIPGQPKVGARFPTPKAKAENPNRPKFSQVEYLRILKRLGL